MDIFVPPNLLQTTNNHSVGFKLRVNIHLQFVIDVNSGETWFLFYEWNGIGD